MRKAKYDKKIEKAIMKLLDGLAQKHSFPDVRRAASRWVFAQQASELKRRLAS